MTARVSSADQTVRCGEHLVAAAIRL